MRVKPRSRKKTIIITVVILALILASSLLWYYAFSGRDTDKIQNTTTSQQKKTTNSQKDNQDTDTTDTTDVNDKTTKQSVPHEKEKELPQLYEGSNANTSEGLTGVITTKSVMGDNLVIRNTVDQLVNGGTCTLTLTSGSKIITKTAEIVQNPSSSTCAGFDIPITELGKGSWSIEIKVSSGDKSMTLKETVNT